MRIEFLENEYWYGGIVHLGAKLPISEDDDITLELVGGKQACDQYSPIFLSNQGRILHSNNAFNVRFNKGVIEIDDKYSVELLSGYNDLRSAHIALSEKHFSLSGKTPDLAFFKTPQYNTWIELKYNQNQNDILNYARTMIDGGMPAGVLMIDEGWAPDYGIYEFSKEKFDDPKAMVDELHTLGFKVMLWVTPMISPDSDCFRELRNTDILLHDSTGEIAVRKWWNGYSCVLDFTNPSTCDWYREKLFALMDKYGIDGFKFDSGDTYLYREGDKAHIQLEPNGNTEAFNRFCEEFTFNELRNVWNCGGLPIVCRLQDKFPSWDFDGIKTLIPNMLTQGILGYYFGCPDMIGGGNYAAFNEGYHTDEDMYLRWLSASLLCPMMQFSISPKRILSPVSFKAVKKLTAVRQKYTDLIVALAKNAATNGEPILRYMEYQFPHCGYEKITDQFMLGSDILVAPITDQFAYERQVVIPRGMWKTEKGDMLEGGRTLTIRAEIDELIILTKVK